MKEPNFNSNNYYEILGLEENSTLKEIKNSFRVLAKKYHPDKNKGDTSKSKIFIKVNKAYEILSNKNDRKEYDESLKKFNFEGTIESWEDYFDKFFNKKPTKGDDVHVYCRLTLEELKVGCEKIITISNEKLKVKINPNTKPETTLKISGKGNIIPDCPIPGDLYIKLIPKPHNYFKLTDSGDLVIQKEISYQDLILGRDIVLNTLTSKVKLTIPKRSDISKEYRLKGLGLGNGDIILKLKLYIPSKELSTKEKNSLKELNRYSNLSY